MAHRKSEMFSNLTKKTNMLVIIITISWKGYKVMSANALKKEDYCYTNNNEWCSKTTHLLRQRDVANPALQRLKNSINGKTGLVITSYDRMHHRHNRS
jgi:hypothetical protein